MRKRMFKLRSSSEPRPWEATLLHPIVLIALAAWMVNDHVLKMVFPGTITGKLSDVASLIVFPLLPVAIAQIARGRNAALGNKWLVASVLATGFVMATINLFDCAAWVYRWGLGALQWPARTLYPWLATGSTLSVHPVELTMDATDLLTLPALLVPLLLAWRSGRVIPAS